MGTSLTQVGVGVAPAVSDKAERVQIREVFFIYHFGNGSQRREVVARQVQFFQSAITLVCLAAQLDEVFGQFVHAIGGYTQRFQVFQFADFLAQRYDTCLIVGVALDVERFQVFEVAYFFGQHFAFLQVEQGELDGTYASYRAFGYVLVGCFP